MHVRKAPFTWVWVGSLLSIAACSGDDPPPAPPTVIQVSFVDRVSGAAVAGAWARVGDAGAWTETTAGVVRLEVGAGAHPVEVVAPGYLAWPPPFVAAPEVVAVEATTVTATIALDAVAQPAPGILRGKVMEAGAPAVGALVVARGSVDAAGWTDAEGGFVITNLPLGSYQVAALTRGKSSAAVTASADAAGSASVEVSLESGGGVALTGDVTGDGAASARLDLLHAASGRPLPGVDRSATGGRPFTIEGVPPGRYVLAAGIPTGDGWVTDPEPLRRGPRIIEVADAPVSNLEVGLAPSLGGLSPAAGEVVGATPSFAWDPLGGADFYVLELLDASGRTVWGGFDATGNWRFRVLPTENPRAYDGPALTARARYRWRVYAAAQDPQVPSGFSLIGASEILDGGFSVGP